MEKLASTLCPDYFITANHVQVAQKSREIRSEMALSEFSKQTLRQAQLWQRQVGLDACFQIMKVRGAGDVAREREMELLVRLSLAERISGGKVLVLLDRQCCELSKLVQVKGSPDEEVRKHTQVPKTEGCYQTEKLLTTRKLIWCCVCGGHGGNGKRGMKIRKADNRGYQFSGKRMGNERTNASVNQYKMGHSHRHLKDHHSDRTWLFLTLSKNC